MAVLALLGLGFAFTSGTVATPLADSIARARALLEAGDVEKARELFQAELKRDPSSVAAVRGLFACARDSGDDETAAAWLRRWVELDGRNALAWKQLALTLARLGSDMEALAAVQTALSLVPQDPVLNTLVSRLLVGRPEPGQVPGLPEPARPREPRTGAPGREPDPTRHFPSPGNR